MRIKVLDGDGPLRVGTVTEVYASKPNPQGTAVTLYAVDWDHLHYEERGYMRHGLIKLPPEKL